jgi:hypothetical protein
MRWNARFLLKTVLESTRSSWSWTTPRSTIDALLTEDRNSTLFVQDTFQSNGSEPFHDRSVLPQGDLRPQSDEDRGRRGSSIWTGPGRKEAA